MIHIKVETNKSSSDNMEMYLAKGRDTFQHFAAHISEAGSKREREREKEKENGRRGYLTRLSALRPPPFVIVASFACNRVDISIPMFH